MPISGFHPPVPKSAIILPCNRQVSRQNVRCKPEANYIKRRRYLKFSKSLIQCRPNRRSLYLFLQSLRFPMPWSRLQLRIPLRLRMGLTHWGMVLYHCTAYQPSAVFAIQAMVNLDPPQIQVPKHGMYFEDIHKHAHCTKSRLKTCGLVGSLLECHELNLCVVL